MKRMQPTAWFWVVAAAAVAVALFTVGNAYGQGAGSSAVFEGRPAMGGAQGGLGPMAGPPQGGLGPQSPQDPGSGPRALGTKPEIPRDPGPIPRDPGMDRAAPNGDLRPQRDRDDVIKRDRDDHGLQQQGKGADKAKRAGKRSIERARRGVSGVDS